MNLGQNGIGIIKKYEGLRLTAYKAVSTEKYYTIGYGHYGPDVKKGMTITQAQAEAYLMQDCQTAVKAVNKYQTKYGMNQNQFDALVSFTYNCGAGNLDKLTAGGTRTLVQIAAKFPAYNKAGGKELAGLTRRRAEEQALFNASVASYVFNGVDYGPVFEPDYYAGKYPDLQTVFSGNSAMLWQHFTYFGMAEGRQASAEFNPAAYRRNYADLDKAFGNNWIQYYQHYILCGASEGRKAY